MPVKLHWVLVAAVWWASGVRMLAAEDTLRLVREGRQVAFPHHVPAGNYSGICHWQGDEYLLVSDKSATDGFFVFAIAVDSLSGEIVSVENRGFRSSGLPNRDGEGIAWVPDSAQVFVCGESDGRIRGYDINGKLVHREMAVPAVYATCSGNFGLESLSYSPVTHCLWTCNESTLRDDGQQATSTNGVCNRIRFQSFAENGQPLEQYAYEMDAPVANRPAALYAMGVPEVLALDNGTLLVLEREFYVPKIKVGAFVNCKLYQVWPDGDTIESDKAMSEDTPFLPKHLVCEWKTTLNLLGRKLANYEGLCLGPRLADGSQVLILVADSQDRYGGVLKDWFKTIVVR